MLRPWSKECIVTFLTRALHLVHLQHIKVPGYVDADSVRILILLSARCTITFTLDLSTTFPHFSYLFSKFHPRSAYSLRCIWTLLTFYNIFEILHPVFERTFKQMWDITKLHYTLYVQQLKILLAIISILKLILLLMAIQKFCIWC